MMYDFTVSHICSRLVVDLRVMLNFLSAGRPENEEVAGI